MKLYIIYDIRRECAFKQTESKREANKYLREPHYRVWSIVGRKGNQIDARFWQTMRALETNMKFPDYVTEEFYVVQKRKRDPGTNEKISRALAGKSKSLEHCQAISEAMLGNSNRSRR